MDLVEILGKCLSDVGVEMDPSISLCALLANLDEMPSLSPLVENVSDGKREKVTDWKRGVDPDYEQQIITRIILPSQHLLDCGDLAWVADWLDSPRVHYPVTQQFYFLR